VEGVESLWHASIPSNLVWTFASTHSSDRPTHAVCRTERLRLPLAYRYVACGSAAELFSGYHNRWKCRQYIWYVKGVKRIWQQDAARRGILRTLQTSPEPGALRPLSALYSRFVICGPKTQASLTSIQWALILLLAYNVAYSTASCK